MTGRRENDDAFRSNVRTKDGQWGYIKLRKVAQGGAPVQWSFFQPDGGPSTDRTVVKLVLPQPVAPGASTTLDLHFFDQLPRAVARTGYYQRFHLVAQWSPKIGLLELPVARGDTAPRWNSHAIPAHRKICATPRSFH